MKKLFVAVFVTVSAFADEGMWMPQQMPEIAAELKKAGVTIDPQRLADLTGDPMGAVVSLGGCTASFVSPDGLVVTNHHCAFGSIQHNSTPERDLITNGFLAKTRAEELPAAPGTKVWVTTNFEDVTTRVTNVGRASARPSDGRVRPLDGRAEAHPTLTDAELAKLIDRRTKELVAECEKPGGVRCRVSSFFEGSQYLRTTQMEISDVRLVYAPARMIGEFGGEIDNFEWPRHTGDFAFYRAYVNGKPYQPKHWLKVAKQGVNVGDAVLVAGYPGRTFRYKTADEVRNYRDFVYPANIRYYTEIIRLLEKAGDGNRDVQIRNASRIKSLANSLKNYQSTNEGFVRDRIVEARLGREAKMRLANASVLDEIARLNAGHFRNNRRDLILDILTGRGSPMLQQAFTFVRVATERPKKDMDRVAKYQEREWESLRSASDRAQRTIDAGSDRAVVAYFLDEGKDLEELQGIDANALYANTKITDQRERTKMLGESVAQLKARHDSMIDLAFKLLPVFEQRESEEWAYTGAMARLRPKYFELLRQVSGGAVLYPDANSTLRITIGTVEGYTPRDATFYQPQTTLRGVVEKETGKDPFENPKSLLAAAADPAKTRAYIDPELGDVPVNFLSTCDTTGGNSGSPTLNAKGELVGLLFDGNYESIDADFLFTPAITRSIHVDAQYMLWVMDAVDGAQALMRELGVEPRLQDR
ncbi:MAG TPA: S46 family peptidase [Thermoanaerobaculia bacterium]|nr:S46 family peptidase [Thermoanaerobaculia bacterium]